MQEKTEVLSSLQLTEFTSGFQTSESLSRTSHIPFKVLQSVSQTELSSRDTGPLDLRPSFTPALDGMIKCTQRLEDEVNQVKDVVHESKTNPDKTYSLNHTF